MHTRIRRRAPFLPIAAAALLLLPAGLAGQDVEERFPGVNLGLLYEGRTLPALAIQPFQGRMGGGSAASRAENIVARDLRYSNRFEMLDSIPASLVRDEVDYALWDELGATWLVTGRVEGAGSGSVLILEVHDVIYREVREEGRFPMPDSSSPDFRMAAHLASDAVVRWITGEPGIAATRISFARRMEDGSQDLWAVDSDGENLRRLTRERAEDGGQPLALSPAWSPDGSRVAYTSYRTGLWRIREINLETGEERAVPTPQAGDYITPAYHPDGERVVFAVNGGGASGLYGYDLAADCCFERLTEGRWEDLSPSYAPDGSRLTFNSNRLGSGAPQIYIMEEGNAGRPTIVSPHVYDRPGYYTSPEWSPRGDRVAYHGRVERVGQHQILVTEVGGRGAVQLTETGNNEDPSWAPDGRHLVYIGVRSWGYGLFIVDVETGTTRTLVSGMRVNTPAWSPSLGTRAAEDGE